MRIIYHHFVARLIIAVIFVAVMTFDYQAAFVRADEPLIESRPGESVILRADPKYVPARVTPPEQTELGVQSAIFNVTYNGFPAGAQAAFQRAVDIWASLIESNVTIEVEANWKPLGVGILGSAGPKTYIRNFVAAPHSNTWYPVGLANAISGIDLSPAASDIEANFNSSFGGWYFGTDGNPGLGQYDFVSVVLHELGHGLGFTGGLFVQTGQGHWSDTNPDIYDRFTFDANGTSLLNTSSYPNPSVALANPLQGGGPSPGGSFFNGINARAANGNAVVKLYTPNPWEGGSSYSHLDESTYPPGNPNALMTPQLSNGESAHNPGVITLSMFKDMGWTVNLLPQLSVTITPDPFLIEETTSTIDYTLSLSNNSSLTANNVVITNTIPAETTFVTASNGGNHTAGVIVWPAIATLAGNSSVVRTFTVNVAAPVADGDQLVNTVSVSTSEGAAINNLQISQTVGAKLTFLPIIVK